MSRGSWVVRRGSWVMKNHMYTFDNQIKLKSKDGPIDWELTGVTAQLLWSDGTGSSKSR